MKLIRSLPMIFILTSWVFGPKAIACEVEGPIRFAGLDWESNAFHTEVARYILENGYGCKTSSIPGTTIPMLQGMVQGDVDVTMELWEGQLPPLWDKALKRGKVTKVGTNFPDAEQGWFVPRYLVEGDAKAGIKPQAPDLKKVTDLIQYKELFKDPEEPKKGRFYNCILGWMCETVNSKKFEIYGFEEHFTNFRPGTGAALAAAIAAAYKRHKPIVFYYWGPTWVMGAFDLIKLEEPPFDQKTWDELVKKRRPKKAVAFPKTEVFVGANAKFAKKAPKTIAFLRKYETTNKDISRALAYIRDGKDRTAKDAAIHFLKNNQKMWHQWVPEEVQQKVDKTLN